VRTALKWIFLALMARSVSSAIILLFCICGCANISRNADSSITEYHYRPDGSLAWKAIWRDNDRGAVRQFFTVDAASNIVVWHTNIFGHITRFSVGTATGDVSVQAAPIVQGVVQGAVEGVEKGLK